ncbi:MAG: hypothetical protein JJD98_00220 [Polaromonas sp.]|nr:hypothetical protein [Polaromonas sp.]
MKTISAPAIAAIATGRVGIVQLIHMAFSTTPVSLNMSTWDLVYGGITYKGAYGLGTISAINDKPGEIAGLSFELAAGTSSVIGLALDDADIVQGTPVTIRTAIIDLDTHTILDAPIEWAGTLDTMSIGEDGTQATIRCTAESKAVDLLRGTPMVYGDADQRTVNASDGSMRFIVYQIDKPIVWPQKQFFYQ